MKNILLIEDNRDVRENTTEILELAGYNVCPVTNGKEGIEEVNNNIPDLIICDIMMPELDGYGVLHLLGQKPETATIPFIFLTAKAERSEVRQGMEMGADDYITKPFEKTELLRAVERRLKKVEVLQKRYSSNMNGLSEFLGDIGGEQTLKVFTESKKNNLYRKKDNIYAEGNYPNGLYYVNRGRVKIYKRHTLGKELITGILGEGEFFGYTYLITGKPFGESAQALEETEITYIPGIDFFNLIYNNREIAKKFIDILTQDLTSQNEILLDMAYSSVRKRIAEALLQLKERYKLDENTSSGLSISRENLASIVGTATESLIRTLSDFREEGLIEIADGKIMIADEKRLREMKN